MTTKITRDVIESYLSCRYKGHLKLAGQQGTRSDYELLLAETRDAVRRQVTDKLRACHQGDAIECDLVLTPAVLRKGAAFLINATLEDQHVSLSFDGLKRVDGPSKLGDFHYVPVLFFEGRQVRQQQRALLDVYGLLVSRLQGRAPGSGVIWHGQECRAGRVRLNPDPRKAERLLEELCEMQTAGVPPGPAGAGVSGSLVYVIALSLVAAVGGFLFGFDSGVINGAVDALAPNAAGRPACPRPARLGLVARPNEGPQVDHPAAPAPPPRRGTR
jgi:hypothetical protein